MDDDRKSETVLTGVGSSRRPGMVGTKDDSHMQHQKKKRSRKSKELKMPSAPKKHPRKLSWKGKRILDHWYRSLSPTERLMPASDSRQIVLANIQKSDAWYEMVNLVGFIHGKKAHMLDYDSGLTGAGRNDATSSQREKTAMNTVTSRSMRRTSMRDEVNGNNAFSRIPIFPAANDAIDAGARDSVHASLEPDPPPQSGSATKQDIATVPRRTVSYETVATALNCLQGLAGLRHLEGDIVAIEVLGESVAPSGLPTGKALSLQINEWKGKMDIFLATLMLQ